MVHRAARHMRTAAAAVVAAWASVTSKVSRLVFYTLTGQTSFICLKSTHMQNTKIRQRSNCTNFSVVVSVCGMCRLILTGFRTFNVSWGNATEV
jgi:hypothetical protein